MNGPKVIDLSTLPHCPFKIRICMGDGVMRVSLLTQNQMLVLLMYVWNSCVLGSKCPGNRVSRRSGVSWERNAGVSVRYIQGGAKVG